MKISHTNGNVKLAVVCTSLEFRKEVQVGNKNVSKYGIKALRIDKIIKRNESR